MVFFNTLCHIIQPNHLICLLVKSQLPINPMNFDTLALHSAEPSHLPFRESADVGIKIPIHFLIGALMGQILGNMLIFQSIFQQPFYRNSIIEQTLYFFHHPILETLPQSNSNPFNHHLARKGHPHYNMLHLGHNSMKFGVLTMVLLDF